LTEAFCMAFEDFVDRSSMPVVPVIPDTSTAYLFCLIVATRLASVVLCLGTRLCLVLFASTMLTYFSVLINKLIMLTKRRK